MEFNSRSLKIAVILVNYNNYSDTVSCIESLWKTGYEKQDIYLVDNQSTDKSFECLLVWMKRRVADTKEEVVKNVALASRAFAGLNLNLILANQNKGFAAGCNLGIKVATEKGKYDFYWLLNNDTEVSQNIYETINSFYYTNYNDKLGILGTKLRYWNQRDKIQAVGGIYNKRFALTKHIGEGEVDKGQYDFYDSRNIDYFVGASVLIRRDVTEKVGLLNENFFLYFEELDYFIRASRFYDKALIPEAIVFHKEGASINGRERKSKISDYYGLRNRLVFTRMYFPEHEFTVKCALIYSLIKRLLMCQFSRVSWILKLIVKSNIEM